MSEEDAVFDHASLVSRWNMQQVSFKEHTDELIVAFEACAAQCLILQKKLRDEKNLADKFKHDWQELKAEGDVLEKLHKSDAFTLVLIDGDGYIFNDHFLRKGEDGALEALTQLKDDLRREIGEEGRLVIRIFANLRGLTKVCFEHRLIQSERVLEEFFKKLSRQSSLREDFVDFVDVGPAKDAADDKVKENYLLHRFHPQCRKIVLGVTHDRGYAKDLEIDQKHEIVRDRVLLLECTASEPDFKRLKYRSVRFDSVFRNTKFNNAPVSAPVGPKKQTASSQPVPHHPIWSNRQDAVCLNKHGLRVDEPLPKHDPTAFTKAIDAGKRFCRSYYLMGGCTMRGGTCNMKHEGLDTNGLFAFYAYSRKQPCKTGDHCKSRTCPYGHQCPDLTHADADANGNGNGNGNGFGNGNGKKNCKFSNFHKKDCAIKERVAGTA